MPLPTMDLPPNDSRPFIYEAKVGCGPRLICQILSPAHVGVGLHYKDGRSQLCTAGTGHCPLCEEGLKPRWYGFLAVLVMPNRLVRMVRLTDACVRHCPALLQSQGQLRGKLIELSRTGGSPQSGMKAHLYDAQPGQELPRNAPYPDLEGAMSRMLGVSSQVNKQEDSEDQVATGDEPAPGSNNNGAEPPAVEQPPSEMRADTPTVQQPSSKDTAQSAADVWRQKRRFLDGIGSPPNRP